MSPAGLPARTARATAFIYAGAVRSGADLEGWGGHVAFAQEAVDYAEAIVRWVADRPHDDHPGIMAYELLEPLGAWLVTQSAPDQRGVAEVLEVFKKNYLAWL